MSSSYPTVFVINPEYTTGKGEDWIDIFKLVGLLQQGVIICDRWFQVPLDAWNVIDRMSMSCHKSTHHKMEPFGDVGSNYIRMKAKTRIAASDWLCSWRSKRYILGKQTVQWWTRKHFPLRWPGKHCLVPSYCVQKYIQKKNLLDKSRRIGFTRGKRGIASLAAEVSTIVSIQIFSFLQ